MSHSGRTRILYKACPNCGLVQDSENWVCDECNFPENWPEEQEPRINENNHGQGEPS